MSIANSVYIFFQFSRSELGYFLAALVMFLVLKALCAVAYLVEYHDPRLAGRSIASQLYELF